ETVPDAEQPLADDTEALPAGASTGSKWMALSVAAALLIGLVGVITWRVSTSNEEPFVAPPIVLPEPPKAPEPVVHLDAPEVQVSDEQIAAALKEASNQYEEGQ